LALDCSTIRALSIDGGKNQLPFPWQLQHFQKEELDARQGAYALPRVGFDSSSFVSFVSKSV